MIFIIYTASNKNLVVSTYFGFFYNKSSFKDFLKFKNYILINLKEFHINISFKKKRIPPNELIRFFQELGIMLKSGLTLLKALTLLKDEAKNKLLKEIIISLIFNIKKGNSFNYSLAPYSNILGSLYINMLIIGEQSGTLPEILENISLNIKRNHFIKKKIKSLLFYPSFVFFLTILLSIVLIVFVLPEFIKIFNENEQKLPFLTIMLIDIYNFLNNFFITISFTIISLIVFLFFYLKKDHNRYFFYHFISIFPPFKRVYNLYFSISFFRNLSILLDSGTSLFNSINFLIDIERNPVLKQELLHSKQQLSSGKTLGETLKNSTFFPASAISMISIGEASGNLSEMTSHAGELLYNNFTSITDFLLMLIEPITILFLGTTVGIIVFGLYLPMFNMLSFIK